MKFKFFKNLFIRKQFLKYINCIVWNEKCKMIFYTKCSDQKYSRFQNNIKINCLSTLAESLLLIVLKLTLLIILKYSPCHTLLELKRWNPLFTLGAHSILSMLKDKWCLINQTRRTIADFVSDNWHGWGIRVRLTCTTTITQFSRLWEVPTSSLPQTNAIGSVHKYRAIEIGSDFSAFISLNSSYPYSNFISKLTAFLTLLTKRVSLREAKTVRKEFAIPK